VRWTEQHTLVCTELYPVPLNFQPAQLAQKTHENGISGRVKKIFSIFSYFFAPPVPNREFIARVKRLLNGFVLVFGELLSIGACFPLFLLCCSPNILMIDIGS
jgi:hypothetical protein